MRGGRLLRSRLSRGEGWAAMSLYPIRCFGFVPLCYRGVCCSVGVFISGSSTIHPSRDKAETAVRDSLISIYLKGVKRAWLEKNQVSNAFRFHPFCSIVYGYNPPRHPFPPSPWVKWSNPAPILPNRNRTSLWRKANHPPPPSCQAIRCRFVRESGKKSITRSFFPFLPLLPLTPSPNGLPSSQCRAAIVTIA